MVRTWWLSLAAGLARGRPSLCVGGSTRANGLVVGFGYGDDGLTVERVEIFLLGGFRVRVDGTVVPGTAWRHGRARDLVKLLALARGRRIPRDRVLEDLWPHLGVEAALRNLHKAAHHARRALGDAGGVVRRVYRTSRPLARWTSQIPPNSSTFWHLTSPIPSWAS